MKNQGEKKQNKEYVDTEYVTMLLCKNFESLIAHQV